MLKMYIDVQLRNVLHEVMDAFRKLGEIFNQDMTFSCSPMQLPACIHKLMEHDPFLNFSLIP